MTFGKRFAYSVDSRSSTIGQAMKKDRSPGKYWSQHKTTKYCVSKACQDGAHHRCYKLTCTCMECGHGVMSLDVTAPAVNTSHGKATVAVPISTDAVGRQL